jgi:site-specific DNA recombinase
LDWLTQALKESHRDEKAYHDAAISTLQGQYTKLQSRIDQAYTDKLDGKMPEDVVLRKIGEWRSNRPGCSPKFCSHQVANQNYLEEGANYSNSRTGPIPCIKVSLPSKKPTC